MNGMVKLAMCLSLAGLILLPGCAKKSEPVKPTPAEKAAPETKEKVAAAQKEAEKTAQKTKETVATVVEQTTCPVTGQPIDKNVFVEYKGKKVYFCCADCKGQFEKEPEKYVSKLPQFAK
jgi:YHS domain-containing protein